MTQISPAISLDEVVAREIPVQWDEAVAVVEELCGMLTAGRGAELPVPELNDIRISADGTLTLSDGAISERGAPTAGRTLHALLSAANTPAPLRLFVTHATSPDAYTSIRDFAAGLAYFGKPARAPLIRELYERCAAAGLPSTGHLPRQIAVSNKQPSAKSPAPETSARTRWTRGATVATAASLAGAGIWFWSSTETDRTTKTSLPTLISEVKSAMQTLESDVSTYLGFRPPPIRGAQDAARPKATHASSRLMKPHRRRDERQPISSIPLSPDRNQQAVTTVPLLDQSLTIDEPARAETRVEDRQVERAIYSSHDADVRPPVLQFPQLASARGDSRPDVMNRMELVVSADGTVEHVRLVAGPNRMTDMMLLSGAKMWRFTPAVKDGKPVRYRTVVSWIAGP